MPFRVFNLAEAAEYLSMQEKALEELARRGEIPCLRQGGHLHFRHHDIDEWASDHVLHLDDKNLEAFHRRSGSARREVSADEPIMPSLVRPEWIAPALACRTKASVLDEMATLADATELVADRKELLDSLTEREKLCSTALSGGLALLHPRVHEPYMFFDSFIVVGKTIAQIPFGSPDRSTTDIFFLVCCQDDRIHLHVLARLCMMCHRTSLLMEMRETDDPKELHRILLASETELLAAPPTAGGPHR